MGLISIILFLTYYHLVSVPIPLLSPRWLRILSYQSIDTTQFSYFHVFSIYY